MNAWNEIVFELGSTEIMEKVLATFDIQSIIFLIFPTKKYKSRVKSYIPSETSCN